MSANGDGDPNEIDRRYNRAALRRVLAMLEAGEVETGKITLHCDRGRVERIERNDSEDVSELLGATRSG